MASSFLYVRQNFGYAKKIESIKKTILLYALEMVGWDYALKKSTKNKKEVTL